MFGEDAYPGISTKAASLLHSLVRNHARVDGNERLGWLATATSLEINGVSASAIPNDDVYEFVMSVASTSPDLDALPSRLTAICRG